MEFYPEYREAKRLAVKIARREDIDEEAVLGIGLWLAVGLRVGDWSPLALLDEVDYTHPREVRDALKQWLAEPARFDSILLVHDMKASSRTLGAAFIAEPADVIESAVRALLS
ncbi:MAG: hypothetical protein KDA43_14775 [Hyphomonas sp.]|nr:hypothetical protein [Hyphomonas sp.]